MPEPTQIRLRWLTPTGATEAVVVRVRSVSEKAAFALLATAHGPGTRGSYELLDARGQVLREGACKILFQRKGAGVGLELLKRPPLRRSTIPAERHSGRPPTQREVTSVRPPAGSGGSPSTVSTGQSVSPDRSPKPVAAQGPAITAAPKQTPKTERPTRPPRSPRPAPMDVEEEAPERILGARPRSAPPRRVSSSDPPLSQPKTRSDAPPVSTPDSPSIDTSAVTKKLREAEEQLRADAMHAVTDRAPARVSDLPSIEFAEPTEPTPSDELPGIEFGEPIEPPSPQAWVNSEVPASDEPAEAEPAPSERPERASTPFPAPSDRPPPAQRFSERPEAKPPEAKPPIEPEVPKTRRSESPARLATRVGGVGAREGVAIGIDLGTSNTCASAVIDGRPQVIPTRFGTSTVPSVLTVIDSRVVVGHAAAKRMIMNPHETIYGSKRLVGRAYSDELAEEYQPFFAYPLVATESNQFGASLRGRVVSFEDVAEYLLAEVRDVAEQFLGQPVDRAVITVPAYFGEAQRDAVRRAARGARLTVDRIVPEPTAAAVAYGYDASESQTLVVFDLGGGTFDVSVLRAHDNEFEVLATGGDAFLGGIDIDDLLANHLLELFNTAERTTLDPTPQQLARLRDAAEECKRGLSMQNRFSVHLNHFARVDGEPRDLVANVTREELDGMATGFCDRLLAITASTLADCRLSATDIDEILLVGGMTRMNLVSERAEEYFGKRPSKKINPDEAVALGAARLAEDGGQVRLIDVLPLSIGVAGAGRRFLRLIPRNTSVPTKRSFVLHTDRDDVATHRVPLFQGERADAAENEYLGTIVIGDIPKARAGQALELTFALDEQCFLEISAVSKRTDEILPVHIDRQHGAERAIADLGGYEGDKEEAVEKKTPSALGRFFKKLRSMFG